MLTAQDIKLYARELGADLVGIGSMDRFEGAPKEYDPRHIMPEAKSIIGLGFRIHRSLLRGIEEDTYWGGYSSMGYGQHHRQLRPHGAAQAVELTRGRRP